VEAKTRILRWD